MPHVYIDADAIKAAMKKKGLSSGYDLTRALYQDGYQVAPSTVHKLLSVPRYNPRVAFVQAICATLGIKFKAPVNADGKINVKTITAAMRRYRYGTLDLWRAMIDEEYEGTHSSIRHVLSESVESPRLSTVAALCDALGLPFEAPVAR